MTFKVYGEIEIDGKGARAEIKGVDKALDDAARSGQKFGASGGTAAGGMGKLKGETTLAAGSVANLGAQFNDIGVMLAAGQNPLQLAIQQGTQITQVFGSAGAAARVSMLKAAFASVISPVNLMTIGVIAGGAALAQLGMSAFSAGEDANGLAEKIEAVIERIAGLRDEVRSLELGFSTEELALADAMVAKEREIAQLRKAVASSPGPVARDRQRELQIREDELRVLREQLEELRQLEAERERLITGTRETADAERQVGENVGRTVQEIKEAEAMAQLLRDGVKATVIEAMMLAGIDITSGISSAANEAARLASNLNISFEQAQRYIRLRDGGVPKDPVIFDPRDPRYDPVKAEMARGIETAGSVSPFDPSRQPKSSTGRRRSGSSASAASAERDAVQDLIGSLNEQLDILRATDPIQKEMIRNRETLKSATDAEKQSVEQLIATRIAEEAAIEQASQNAQDFKDLSWEALDGVMFRADSASDAVANLADMLAQAAAQSLLLGEGPLAGLFGTRDSGGLLGMIGSALFPGAEVPGNADGGIQYGPGGPRDDRKHIRVSPGEFVVNAQATAQNRAILEYINGGGLVGNQGFASGGMPVPVAMQGAQGGGFGGAGRMTVQIALNDALLEARVVETSQGVFAEGMGEYRSNVLPRDVDAISRDPGRIG